ncbi:MAG: TAXI family TRAP transporter solute-binding subunit [Acidobacteriota bacterium]|nr:TAXI family TRAP transporter solute-binding subunit [Acidobacteriota bacterium]
MRRPLLLALCLAAVSALGGCSSGEENVAPRPQMISIGTAPQGGTFFIIGSAIADVIGEHDPGLQVTAEATKGSQENIRRLARGEIEVALANSAITYFASRGEAGWDRAYPVNAVMTLAPNVALFIAPDDGDVKTVADLAGKRVVVGPAGAGFEFFLRPILEAHGVTYDDFTPLNASQFDSVALLADGSAAAVFLGGGVPTASITQASSSQDILFVPYDPKAVEELVGTYLFFNRATIPAGTYRGQEQDYAGLDVGSMHLIVSAEADEALVYRLTQALYENRAEVVSKHAAGKAINAKNVVRDTGTPFHPGAVRFYREIGIWPE